LIELLIAITLVGLILALGFSGLRTGLRSWESVESAIGATEDRRLVEGFLRRQIAQARPVPELETGPDEPVLAFRGEPGLLEFVAPLPQRDRVGGLYRFRLEIRKAEIGQELRLTYRHHLPEVEPPTDAEPARLLMAELSDGAFAYYGAPEPEGEAIWHDSWDGAAGLPHLVRLRAATGAATAGADRLDLVFPLWATAVEPRRGQRPGQGGSR
jgi:general secretion pathway protein J